MPPGTEHGTNVTIKDYGFVSLSNPTIKGDMIITVLITVPKSVNEEQKKLLLDLDRLFAAKEK